MSVDALFFLYPEVIFIFLSCFEYVGTDSNPFSLDALAVFMFRVLQRDNHPVCW